MTRTAFRPAQSPAAQRRHCLTALGSTALAAALFTAAPAWAQKANPETFTPHSGQAGKDVIWVPTPDELVTRMLQLGGVGKNDFVMDLGAGDGKIVIAAAKQFGARGLGIEYNPDMVAHAMRRAKEAGVTGRATIEQGDIFETDLSKADVITMYLLPTLNLKLRPTLMKLKPGTRLVTHAFTMGGWQPDETSRAGGANAYLWLVPANFGGEWALRFPLAGGGEARGLLEVEQRFQQISGVAVFRDFTAGLRQPLLAGDRVRFALTDAEGKLREFDGRIAGRELVGTVTQGDAHVPFTASRTDTAIPPIGGSEPVQQQGS